MNEKAAERLRSLLQRISHNSADELCRIGARIRDSKESVVSRFRPIFSNEHLDDLTADEFKSFLLFRNNCHWDSLHRQGGIITADMPKLRAALKVLVDHDLPVSSRLDRLSYGGDVYVHGMARGILTAILQILRPDNYGVWNNVAERAMKSLDLTPVFPRGTSFGRRYEIVNRKLHDIAESLGVDLWTLDMLWWRVEPHTPVGAHS
jgi:hypothetical protein